MRKLALFLASVLIATSGCVISPRRSVNGTGSGGSNSEFNLSANPTSQVITAGSSATFAISVSAVNGFTGTVSLSASSSNTNITASFDNTTITGGSGSATLTVSAANTSTSGNVIITVTASDTANNISQNVSINASVQSSASTVSSMNAIEPVASQTGCVSTPPTSNAQRVSFPVSPTTGFAATFSVTPSSSSMDAALGFFAPASSNQPRLSTVIDFSPAGVIRVRNGDSLVSSAISYVAGETLQFRLIENLPAITYSLFLTSPGAAEIPLATK